LEGLVRARDVMVFLGITREGGYPAIQFIGMRLLLDDGRTFTMVNIPLEVALAVRALKGEGEFPERKSLFDLLANFESFKDEIARTLRRVVINELDPRTGLYTATAEFEEDGLVSKVKMIPSHAVFLAMLVGAPIYVSEDLVDTMDFLEEFKGEEESEDDE